MENHHLDPVCPAGGPRYQGPPIGPQIQGQQPDLGLGLQHQIQGGVQPQWQQMENLDLGLQHQLDEWVQNQALQPQGQNVLQELQNEGVQNQALQGQNVVQQNVVQQNVVQELQNQNQWHQNQWHHQVGQNQFYHQVQEHQYQGPPHPVPHHPVLWPHHPVPPVQQLQLGGPHHPGPHHPGPHHPLLHVPQNLVPKLFVINNYKFSVMMPESYTELHVDVRFLPEPKGDHEEAMMFGYKILECPYVKNQSKSHRKKCFFRHSYIQQQRNQGGYRRRSPWLTIPIMCAIDNCQLEDCLYCHNSLEFEYHPANFRRTHCPGFSCNNKDFCPFAHNDEELR